MRNRLGVWGLGSLTADSRGLSRTFLGVGDALAGTYPMEFNMYTAYTGGSSDWKGTYSVTTDGELNVVEMSL